MSGSEVVMSSSKDSFTCNGVWVSMATHNAFIESSVRNASEILFEDLLFTNTQTLGPVPIPELQDDHEFVRPGNSFVASLENIPIIQDGFTNITSSIRIESPASLQSNESLTRQAALVYRAAAEQFIEHLLIAILLTGGSPPYEEDLLHVRLVDEEVYARGIFILHEKVVILTLNGAATNPAPVARHLPDNVGKMVILYMTDVLPFLRGLSIVTDGFKNSNYLFSGPGGQWSKERYEEILKRESGKALGVELGLNDYKKVFLAIAAAHMPGNFDHAGHFIGEQR